MPADVQRFIPHGPDAELTPDAVDEFVKAAGASRSLRMAVLGALRSDAGNGAEVVLSLMALLISVVGVSLNLLNAGLDAQKDWAVLLRAGEAVTLFIAVLAIVSLAAAAHVRKLKAAVWLAAYEEALRAQTDKRTALHRPGSRLLALFRGRRG